MPTPNSCADLVTDPTGRNGSHDSNPTAAPSGGGGFGFVDPITGKYEALTVLPGFTRGLDFCGPLAFIGLSQVGESAIFSGIAIAERPLEERSCGVWVSTFTRARRSPK